MRISVTYPILMHMLGYIDDQQLHHNCHLMTLGIQVCLLILISHMTAQRVYVVVLTIPCYLTII